MHACMRKSDQTRKTRKTNEGEKIINHTRQRMGKKRRTEIVGEQFKPKSQEMHGGNGRSVLTSAPPFLQRSEGWHALQRWALPQQQAMQREL
jgi:hypothetical protein